MNILAALETFPSISELHESELESLAKRLTVRKVKKGDYLLLSQQNSDSLYLIFDGSVRVTVGSDGKETILAEFGRGEIVGEIAMVSENKRTADVVTLAETTLLELTRYNFVEHSKEYQGFSFLLLNIMADRLRTTSELFAETAMHNVETRLEKMLVRLSEVDTMDENVRIVKPRPTHNELASRIGTSREIVTRAIKSLEAKGLISIEKEAFYLGKSEDS